MLSNSAGYHLGDRSQARAGLGPPPLERGRQTPQAERLQWVRTVGQELERQVEKANPEGTSSPPALPCPCADGSSWTIQG